MPPSEVPAVDNNAALLLLPLSTSASSVKALHIYFDGRLEGRDNQQAGHEQQRGRRWLCPLTVTVVKTNALLLLLSVSTRGILPRGPTHPPKRLVRQLQLV